MTWLAPTSTTIQIGDGQAAVSDDIIIGRSVTIAVSGSDAIDFNSADHTVPGNSTSPRPSSRPMMSSYLDALWPHARN